MEIEDARKVIQEEGLQGYNLCEERENRENEVVLKKENEKWIVYVTDERANKITNSVDKYNTETKAIEDFIKGCGQIKYYASYKRNSIYIIEICCYTQCAFETKIQYDNER